VADDQVAAAVAVEVAGAGDAVAEPVEAGLRTEGRDLGTGAPREHPHVAGAHLAERLVLLPGGDGDVREAVTVDVAEPGDVRAEPVARGAGPLVQHGAGAARAQLRALGLAAEAEQPGDDVLVAVAVAVAGDFERLSVATFDVLRAELAHVVTRAAG